MAAVLVGEFLERSAAAQPGREALVQGEQRWTYRELDRLADALSAVLLEGGIRRGERVAVYLEDPAETVIAVFAALKAGAVFVVLGPLLKARTLQWILDDSGAAALLTDAPEGVRCGDEAKSVRLLLLGGGAAERSLPQAAKPCRYLGALGRAQRPPGSPVATPRVGERDLCALIYTSGSTGMPKGVALTHRNVVAAAGSILQYLDIVQADSVLNFLPLSSDYGLYNVLMPLWRGARVVLDRPFLQPHQLLAPLAREGVTGLPLTPTIVAILRRFRQLALHEPQRVRWITSTGQALSPACSRWLQTTFPAARIFSMYGVTECKRVSYLPPEELANRPTSVGRAIPGTTVHLVGDDGREVREPGVVGELVVRGPHVMQGYWNQPEATARVLREGRGEDNRLLRTGDLFTTDEQGFLYFVGRRDDLVKSGGHRISPRQVEAVVSELDEVCEAAAIAVPHEVLGHALRLAVVLREGSALTREQIRDHCERLLERHLVPREIELRSRLPRTAAGKIDRQALAAESRASPLAVR